MTLHVMMPMPDSHRYPFLGLIMVIPLCFPEEEMRKLLL